MTRAGETVTPERFRQALGCFASGVAIITAATVRGDRLGVTVSSFNSVSLDPPLVLFSLARSLVSFPAWENADHFAVNLLSEQQDGLSNQFAKANADKWNGVATLAGETGSPLLAGALVSLECRRYAAYDGGDHLIVVGEVLALHGGRAAHAPLVFYRSKYRKLSRDEEFAAPAGVAQCLYGW